MLWCQLYCSLEAIVYIYNYTYYSILYLVWAGGTVGLQNFSKTPAAQMQNMDAAGGGAAGGDVARGVGA